MSNRHRLCCEGPAGSQGGRKNLKNSFVSCLLKCITLINIKFKNSSL